MVGNVMTNAANVTRSAGRLWSLGWVIAVRLILYLVIVGFLIQYIYLGDSERIYRPVEAIVMLAGAFTTSLFILALGSGGPYLDPVIAFTYVIDLLVLTRVVLLSGGFNSVFIPYYLPVLVMATAWLPRRFTSVFPSIATLGIAYVGLAHLLVSLNEQRMFPRLYSLELLATLRDSPAHSIVSNMLILAVLFFIVSFLSAILSDKLLMEQHLNAEVLSTMAEGVAVVDAKGRLIYSNAEFSRFFPGVRKEDDFARAADTMLNPPETGMTLDSLLKQEFTGDTVIVHDGRGSGNRPPMEVRVSGISLRGSRHSSGLVFMITDLTLRRRMEKAERNVAHFFAITTMAAGLAHEIRNPLASLRSAIQEVGEAFPAGSQNRTLTDIVISESDRLDRIIGRFLDFSREGELRISRWRLGEVLESMRPVLEHDKYAQNIEYVVTIHQDPEISCDIDRLKEVFLNLSLNAAQAAPASGGRLEVRVDAVRKEAVSGVEVLFTDNGPGMSDASLDHMFEPFFSQRPGGTGMGLPLSRKQVTMHGGDIAAFNLPGGGACFRIWLPCDPIRSSMSQRRRPGSYTEIRRKA